MRKSILKLGGIYMPIMFTSGAAGEGGATDDNDSKELQAIKTIADQIDNFKTLLGEKADAEAFKSVEAELASLKEGLKTMSEKQIMESMEKINGQNAAILKRIEELEEEKAQEREKAQGSKGKKRDILSTKSVESFIKSVFGDDMKSEKSKEPAQIEVKAPETFGYPEFFEGGDDTDTTAFTGRYVDPVLHKIRHKRNMILDYFRIETINVPTLIYLQKEEIGNEVSVSGDPGGAEWILSGQPKPKRSFRVSSARVDAKKVAIFGTVEDELLKDVASLENWIREDFMEQMRERINDGLLNNNPSIDPTAPLGLKVNSIQYQDTPAFNNTVEDPTYIDAMIAVFALLAYLREEAGMAFVSSDVYYRIHNLKDLNLRYQNNPLVYTNNMGELYIAGVHVVWVDQEDIPSTHLMVIGRDLGFRIKAYGAMVFERGLNGEDFREDKTSFRGYQRFLSYIPSNRENSVFYDTWANIIAAIGSPVS